MDNFDFLPSTIQGNLRTGIYGLILVHLFIFLVWIGLTIPTLFKSSPSVNNQIDEMIKKNKAKHDWYAKQMEILNQWFKICYIES